MRSTVCCLCCLQAKNEKMNLNCRLNANKIFNGQLKKETEKALKAFSLPMVLKFMVKVNHKLVEKQINKETNWDCLLFEALRLLLMHAFLLLFNHKNVYVNSMIYELRWCVFYALHKFTWNSFLKVIERFLSTVANLC